MSVKLILPALLCLAVGYGLGSIPGLNENLHWNLWYVIPISGFILGLLMGYLSFKLCYAFNLKSTMLTNLILALSASLGYLAVDYGTYNSISIPYQEEEGGPMQEIKLSELVSFIDFMKVNLGSTSIQGRSESTSFEMGGTASKISFAADLLGAFLGALLVLSGCANTSPYCDDCKRYKSREKKHVINFHYDEEKSPQIFEKISQMMQENDYQGLVAHLDGLSENVHDKKGSTKIEVDQRYCTDCKSATLLGKVSQLHGNDWKEIEDLAFVYNSEPGAHGA